MCMRGGWQQAYKLWGIEETIRERAADLQWRRLASQRYHFEGLQGGRDGRGDDFGKSLKGKAKRQWDILQADGVFTPGRAHQRDQARPECEMCGHTTADFRHLFWECKENCNGRHNAEWRRLKGHYDAAEGKPRCLWTLGIVPKGWLPQVHSLQMQDLAEGDNGQGAKRGRGGENGPLAKTRKVSESFRIRAEDVRGKTQQQGTLCA